MILSMPQLDFFIYFNSLFFFFNVYNSFFISFNLYSIFNFILILIFCTLIENIIYFLTYLLTLYKIIWNYLYNLLFKHLILIFSNSAHIVFQDPGSTTMYAYINAHNNLIDYLVLVLVSITYLLIYNIIVSQVPFSFYKDDTKIFPTYDDLYFKNLVNNFDHCTLVEFLWTILPSIYLESCGASGLAYIYAATDIFTEEAPDTVLKVTGHQWYWDYNYSGFQDSNGSSISFSSSSIDINSSPENSDLSYVQRRFLEVDQRVILPVKSRLKVIITSTDVIHSWAVPALGIKVDAIPGRINQIEFDIDKQGIFRGQCSEFCGVGHGFMPIVIQSCNITDYWCYLISKASSLNLDNISIFNSNKLINFGTIFSDFWIYYLYRFFESCFWVKETSSSQTKNFVDFLIHFSNIANTIPSLVSTDFYLNHLSRIIPEDPGIKLFNSIIDYFNINNPNIFYSYNDDLSNDILKYSLTKLPSNLYKINKFYNILNTDFENNKLLIDNNPFNSNKLYNIYLLYHKLSDQIFYSHILSEYPINKIVFFKWIEDKSYIFKDTMEWPLHKSYKETIAHIAENVHEDILKSYCKSSLYLYNDNKTTQLDNYEFLYSLYENWDSKTTNIYKFFFNQIRIDTLNNIVSYFTNYKVYEELYTFTDNKKIKIFLNHIMTGDHIISCLSRNLKYLNTTFPNTLIKYLSRHPVYYEYHTPSLTDTDYFNNLTKYNNWSFHNSSTYRFLFNNLFSQDITYEDSLNIFKQYLICYSKITSFVLIENFSKILLNDSFFFKDFLKVFNLLSNKLPYKLSSFYFNNDLRINPKSNLLQTIAYFTQHSSNISWQNCVETVKNAEDDSLYRELLEEHCDPCSLKLKITTHSSLPWWRNKCLTSITSKELLTAFNNLYEELPDYEIQMLNNFLLKKIFQRYWFNNHMTVFTKLWSYHNKSLVNFLTKHLIIDPKIFYNSILSIRDLYITSLSLSNSDIINEELTKIVHLITSNYLTEFTTKLKFIKYRIPSILYDHWSFKTLAGTSAYIRNNYLFLPTTETSAFLDNYLNSFHSNLHSKSLSSYICNNTDFIPYEVPERSKFFFQYTFHELYSKVYTPLFDNADWHGDNYTPSKIKTFSDVAAMNYSQYLNTYENIRSIISSFNCFNSRTFFIPYFKETPFTHFFDFFSFWKYPLDLLFKSPIINSSSLDIVIDSYIKYNLSNYNSVFHADSNSEISELSLHNFQEYLSFSFSPSFLFFQSYLLNTDFDTFALNLHSLSFEDKLFKTLIEVSFFNLVDLNSTESFFDLVSNSSLKSLFFANDNLALKKDFKILNDIFFSFPNKPTLHLETMYTNFFSSCLSSYILSSMKELTPILKKNIKATTELYQSFYFVSKILYNNSYSLQKFNIFSNLTSNYYNAANLYLTEKSLNSINLPFSTLSDYNYNYFNSLPEKLERVYEPTLNPLKRYSLLLENNFFYTNLFFSVWKTRIAPSLYSLHIFFISLKGKISEIYFDNLINDQLSTLNSSVFEEFDNFEEVITFYKKSIFKLYHNDKYINPSLIDYLNNLKTPNIISIDIYSQLSQQLPLHEYYPLLVPKYIDKSLRFIHKHLTSEDSFFNIFSFNSYSNSKLPLLFSEELLTDDNSIRILQKRIIHEALTTDQKVYYLSHYKYAFDKFYKIANKKNFYIYITDITYLKDLTIDYLLKNPSYSFFVYKISPLDILTYETTLLDTKHKNLIKNITHKHIHFLCIAQQLLFNQITEESMSYHFLLLFKEKTLDYNPFIITYFIYPYLVHFLLTK